MNHSTIDDLVQGMDESYVRARSSDLETLRAIARLDRAEVWKRDGCRDMAEWVAGHFKKSAWTARHWVRTAHALEELPRTSAALASGQICLEKAIDLTRFVTPASEGSHVQWAARVTTKSVRDRAERCERDSREKVERAHEERFFRYWHAGNNRMWFEGLLPDAEGAKLAKVLDRIADQLAAHPDDPDDPAASIDQRRADALVVMAGLAAASDGDRDQATINVHAQLEDLVNGVNGGQVENGPSIHTEALQQLVCDARIRTILHDGKRGPVGVGYASQHPTSAMMRLLRHRDGGCVFPGCSQRRFVHAHHIVRWPTGPTDLDNLVLVCKVHHDLVHKHGWEVVLSQGGVSSWFRPDGQPYRPGVKVPRVAEPVYDDDDDWDGDLDDLFDAQGPLELTLALGPSP